MRQSQRLGEIILEELEPGVLGHIVKERSEERGIGEGILNSVYSHSQGKTGVVHYFAGPQEELWLIRSER
jgi:hypothetical protein